MPRTLKLLAPLLLLSLAACADQDAAVDITSSLEAEPMDKAEAPPPEAAPETVAGGVSQTETGTLGGVEAKRQTATDSEGDGAS